MKTIKVTSKCVRFSGNFEIAHHKEAANCTVEGVHEPHNVGTLPGNRVETVCPGSAGPGLFIYRHISKPEFLVVGRKVQGGTPVEWSEEILSGVRKPCGNSKPHVPHHHGQYHEYYCPGSGEIYENHWKGSEIRTDQSGFLFRIEDFKE